MRGRLDCSGGANIQDESMKSGVMGWLENAQVIHRSFSTISLHNNF